MLFNSSNIISGSDNRIVKIYENNKNFIIKYFQDNRNGSQGIKIIGSITIFANINNS